MSVFCGFDALPLYPVGFPCVVMGALNLLSVTSGAKLSPYDVLGEVTSMTPKFVTSSF